MEPNSEKSGIPASNQTAETVRTAAGDTPTAHEKPTAPEKTTAPEKPEASEKGTAGKAASEKPETEKATPKTTAPEKQAAGMTAAEHRATAGKPTPEKSDSERPAAPDKTAAEQDASEKPTTEETTAAGKPVSDESAAEAADEPKSERRRRSRGRGRNAAAGEQSPTGQPAERATAQNSGNAPSPEQTPDRQSVPTQEQDPEGQQADSKQELKTDRKPERRPAQAPEQSPGKEPADRNPGSRQAARKQEPKSAQADRKAEKPAQPQEQKTEKQQAGPKQESKADARDARTEGQSARKADNGSNAERKDDTDRKETSRRDSERKTGAAQNNHANRTSRADSTRKTDNARTSERQERTSRRRNAPEQGRRDASHRSSARSFFGEIGRRMTLRTWLRHRFDLTEDAASQEEVIASLTKGVEFRGVNLWVLIFAALVASLGLNNNSVAVIIGAMLISPIMGPIMGIGLALGINDLELLKKSLRNFALMFIVAIITATAYFFLSPISSNTSELLARTEPTTYDLLIALFGGLAGIVAQTRQDRTSTVIPGVAIATALMPPLCTAGFGLATGQMKFFFGAFYLFLINSVFIALATYIMVRFLHYEKKVFFDKVRERAIKRTMMLITLATFIPSVIIGLQTVRVSIFKTAVERYVAHAFNFPNTRVIGCKTTYAKGDTPSQIELSLLGEPLDDNAMENARTQLAHFGLENTKLSVCQASRHDAVDIASLQESYTELLEEKNRRIGEMTHQLSRYRMTNVEVDDISRELGAVMPAVENLSLMKGLTFDTAGTPGDTTVVCVVRTRTARDTVDRRMLVDWLKARTKVDNVKLFVE